MTPPPAAAAAAEKSEPRTGTSGTRTRTSITTKKTKTKNHEDQTVILMAAGSSMIPYDSSSDTLHANKSSERPTRSAGLTHSTLGSVSTAKCHWSPVAVFGRWFLMFFVVRKARSHPVRKSMGLCHSEVSLNRMGRQSLGSTSW